MISLSDKWPLDGWNATADAFINSAARLVERTDQGVAQGQRWIRDKALVKYPLMTLGTAFGLGVFTGWLIKRR